MLSTDQYSRSADSSTTDFTLGRSQATNKSYFVKPSRQSQIASASSLPVTQSPSRLLVVQDPAMNCAQGFPADAEQIQHEVVRLPNDYDSLLTCVESAQPDCLLLMLSCADKTWLQWIAQLGADQPLPIVLWVSTHSEQVMQDALGAGVSGYWVGAPAYHNLVANLAFANAQYAKRRALEKQVITTQARLDDRKWVEKAKGLIMQQNNLSEQEAFCQLRSSAMRQGITLGEISKRVISVFENYS